MFLVFVESYGAVAWQRPDVATRLAAASALARAIEGSGRGVVSAWVRSPTFGSGSGWRTPACSRRRVRDGDDYARLLLRPRNLLTDVFRRDGYRVLALMPGLKQAARGRVCFRFDAIYGETSRSIIEARPSAGGGSPTSSRWRDSDELESQATPAGARSPRFVFFTTISSHVPFRPTPPYQPDWTRMTAARAVRRRRGGAFAGAGAGWTRLAPATATRWRMRSARSPAGSPAMPASR